MATTKSLYEHLSEKFIHYSIKELIQFNNDTVLEQGWGSSRAIFRAALLSTLSKKGLDLSSIISREDGFTSVRQVAVRLEDNRLVPIS
ncbi:5-oxoprolinase [Sphingobacterium sp.]|uniref:5-oxoprolinase n=1 Tax=Sphingobacterium sp. TaxID=341027 RepID=UPI0028A1EF7A|nr:5-oxoprolinase [Sphingobacterium sp.]